MKTFTTLMLSMFLGLAFVSCEMLPAPGESSTSDRVSAASPDLHSIQSHVQLLKWAPPSWTTTMHVSNNGADRTISLNDNIDYKIVLDETMTGKLKFYGGGNITIIGGAFNLQPGNGNASLTFQDRVPGTTARTIHVEGILIDMSDAFDKDGLTFITPTADLQLQNIRITGVHGNATGDHADAIQNWGGAKKIKVFKATVTTDYQGFFLPAETAPIDELYLEKVDFSRQDGPYMGGNSCPNYLWMGYNATFCDTYPGGVYLKDIYVTPPTLCLKNGFTFGSKDVHPSTGAPTACLAMLLTPTQLYWPSADLDITGVVKLGPPSGGQYVPESLVGLGYVSPGYEGCGMCE